MLQESSYALQFAAEILRLRAQARRARLSCRRYKAHVHRDAAHALQQVVGNGGQLLCRDPEGWSRDADSCDRKPLCVENRHGDAAEPFFQFFIVDCVAAATGLFDFGAQCLGRTDRAMGEALEFRAADDVGDSLCG